MDASFLTTKQIGHGVLVVYVGRCYLGAVRWPALAVRADV